MILKTSCRPGREPEERWHALVGWATPKGNFSAVLGKWVAFGPTENDAIIKALELSAPQKRSRSS